MEKFIHITPDNIDNEHICCAFSDIKCTEGYKAKKDLLKQEYPKGYRFYRLDERAKVFIEYANSENCWLPIETSNSFVINCFWVSGKYKKQGLAKKLLQNVIEEAQNEGKDAILTVCGVKKYHFMSDTKWFLKQGFVELERNSNGFCLLAYPINKAIDLLNARFSDNAKSGSIDEANGLVAYYSSRCPFTDYYVNTMLPEAAKKRNIPLKIVKFNSSEEAKLSPSPATIFSLFLNGKFITTDVSVCMDSRFDKIIAKTK
jgi:predicted GNAT family acetyltransferase